MPGIFKKISDILHPQKASRSKEINNAIVISKSFFLVNYLCLFLLILQFENVQFVGRKMLHRLCRLLQTQVAGQTRRNMCSPMCWEILEALHEGRHEICRTQPGRCYLRLIFSVQLNGPFVCLLFKELMHLRNIMSSCFVTALFIFSMNFVIFVIFEDHERSWTLRIVYNKF